MAVCYSLDMRTHQLIKTSELLKAESTQSGLYGNIEFLLQRGGSLIIFRDRRLIPQVLFVFSSRKQGLEGVRVSENTKLEKILIMYIS